MVWCFVIWRLYLGFVVSPNAEIKGLGNFERRTDWKRSVEGVMKKEIVEDDLGNYTILSFFINRSKCKGQVS